MAQNLQITSMMLRGLFGAAAEEPKPDTAAMLTEAASATEATCVPLLLSPGTEGELTLDLSFFQAGPGPQGR